MKQTANVPRLLLALALTIASGTAWALQNGTTLTLDGKVISRDVQTLQGRAYIPLSDMAKILNRSVVKKSGVYSLMPPTGGIPRADNSGKMGADLFSGPWRLKVARVEQVATYNPLYGADKQPVTPKETGDVLAVVTCRLKNGTSEMQEVTFDKNASGNTALMDDQERGYVPLAYDIRNSGYTSAKMPPGTLLDFVVIFSIPAGANLTAFTYTVKGVEMDKSRDFQISLKP